jgi:hypothetical protein
MAGKTKTIGIRLTAELENLLKEEAAKRRMRPTTYAQKLVTDGLTREGTPVEEKLAELHAAIDRLERELPAKLRSAISSTDRNPSAGSSPGRPTALRDWVSQTSGED